MFDIGFNELVLVFVIALLVLGPERLPQAARTMGHWVGRIRAAFNHLREELDREAVAREMHERLKQQMREMGVDERDLNPQEDSHTILPPANKPADSDSDRTS